MEKGLFLKNKSEGESKKSFINKIKDFFLIGIIGFGLNSCDNQFDTETGKWNADFLKKEIKEKGDDLIKIDQKNIESLLDNLQKYKDSKKRKDKNGVGVFIEIEKENKEKQLSNCIVKYDKEKGRIEIVFLPARDNSENENTETGEFGFFAFYSDGTLMLWSEFDNKESLKDFYSKKYFLLDKPLIENNQKIELHQGVKYYYDRSKDHSNKTIFSSGNLNSLKEKTENILGRLKAGMKEKLNS